MPQGVWHPQNTTTMEDCGPSGVKIKVKQDVLPDVTQKAVRVSFQANESGPRHLFWGMMNHSAVSTDWVDQNAAVCGKLTQLAHTWMPTHIHLNLGIWICSQVPLWCRNWELANNLEYYAYEILVHGTKRNNSTFRKNNFHEVHGILLGKHIF